MKLVAFSDPHIDIQEKRGYPKFTEKLNRALATKKPDVILVTGDVGGSLTSVQRFLEEVNLPNVTKIFCPGNHDIWVNSQAFDASWSKYYEILPEVCIARDWHYLPNQPIIIDNVGFAGTMGWYDYSSRNKIWDNKISIAEYETKYNQNNHTMWMDREYVKFGAQKDQAVAEHLNRELINDLMKINSQIFDRSLRKSEKIQGLDPKYDEITVQGKRKVDTIVIGSHIVPFLDFVRFTGDLNWDYFSAFIGNKHLGDIISAIRSNLRRISIFGHTHFPKSTKLVSGIEAICCPIGYPNEWKIDVNSLEELFFQRIVEIEL